MKTKKCGVFAALTAVLFITAALITSCPEPLSLGDFTTPQEKGQTPFVPPEGNTGSQLPEGNTVFQPSEGNTGSQLPEENTDFLPPEKVGYLYLNISIPESEARTIMPDTSAVTSLASFDSFDVYVLEDDGTTVVTSKTGILQAAVAAAIPLAPGDYVVRVFGNVTANGGAVAVGEDEVEIEELAGATATIVLKEIVDGEEDGTFAWDLSPATTTPADLVSMTITGLSTGATPSTNVGTLTLSSGKYTNAGISLKSGYYRVEIEQTKTNYKTVKTLSILHVYQNFTSTFDSFTLPDLKLNVYTVTFDYNDGVSSPTWQTISNVEHGTNIARPNNPTHRGNAAGYSFAGWAYEDDGTTAFGFNDTETPDTFVSDDPIIRTLTVYAKWLPIYTVTFDYNDGRSGSTTYETASVVSGGTVTAPTTNPTHDDGDNAYIFASWCTDQGGTTPFVFSTAITAATTLYAKWTPVYTVTFAYNDGDPHSTGVTAYDTKYVVSGGKVTAPTTDPTHRGNSSINTFDFWCATNNGTTAFDFDTAINAATTLYAIWDTLSTQDLEVDVTDITFTAPVVPSLSATANVNQIDGVSITVTLDNATDFTSYSWYVDGYAAATETADDPLVFSVTELANKIVGDYIIYVEAYVGVIPYSGQIKVSVTLKP